MIEERKGDWCQTFTGRTFWPLDPRPDEIFIEDIAHSLSHQCRYGGHTSKFYSVAQHSVLVARNLPPERQLEGLLHDAPEAYVIDLVRPLKNSLREYRHIEHGVAIAVGARFIIPAEMHPEVKRVDDAILNDEIAQLLKTPQQPLLLSEPPLGIEINPWSARKSRRIFLKEYHRLTGTQPASLSGRLMQRFYNAMHPPVQTPRLPRPTVAKCPTAPGGFSGWSVKSQASQLPAELLRRPL